MTDTATTQQPPSPTSSPAGLLRRPWAALTQLFQPRRCEIIDTRYANAHLLKDIGLSRSEHVSPVSQLGRYY